MVERFHRTLKSALTAHESTQWSTKLPIVILALRNIYRESRFRTHASLVGLWCDTPTSWRNVPRRACCRATDARTGSGAPRLRGSTSFRYESQHTQFEPSDLSQVSHVFVRVDAAPAAKRGAFRSFGTSRKRTFQVQRHRSTSWISIENHQRSSSRKDPTSEHSYAAALSIENNSKKPVRFFSPRANNVVILPSYHPLHH